MDQSEIGLEIVVKDAVIQKLSSEFGQPDRVTKKVTAFDLAGRMGVVVQTDQPTRENAAFVWLPYPADGETVPEGVLEYAGESGRHSNTYASKGLERGKPALKVTLRSQMDLDRIVPYIRAMAEQRPLPEVRLVEENGAGVSTPVPVDTSAMPPAPPPKPRREAIPRAVQREVWQRDGGCCVECGTRERLCFDHIVPFSRGGANTVRNLQLLCERCNLSKGNRI